MTIKPFAVTFAFWELYLTVSWMLPSKRMIILSNIPTAPTFIGYCHTNTGKSAIPIKDSGTCADSADKNLGFSETTAVARHTSFRDAVISQFDISTSKIHRSMTLHAFFQSENDVDFLICWVVSSGQSGYGKTVERLFISNIRGKTLAVILEKIVGNSPSMWHTLFGIPGCMNGTHVIKALPLLHKTTFEGIPHHFSTSSMLLDEISGEK